MSQGRARLYVRALDAAEARALNGTEGAQYPFWSPDSRSIGFFADSKLKRVEAAGGAPFTLCDAPDGKGASWSREGVIVFNGEPNAPLRRVSEGGGDSVPLTKLDPARKEDSHRHPRFLPDGRHFLYLARMPGGTQRGDNVVVAASLDGGPETLLLRSSGAMAEYVAGRLLYLRERTLVAQAFDAARLALAASPCRWSRTSACSAQRARPCSRQRPTRSSISRDSRASSAGSCGAIARGARWARSATRPAT